jgi:hypothetical protein
MDILRTRQIRLLVDGNQICALVGAPLSNATHSHLELRLLCVVLGSILLPFSIGVLMSI